ncbi:MAG: hypothetical protein HYY65_14645, partial [Candidatus Tectomicrobia bacterium]|nr:hypothetical protein [Candidatus Tectomicrobia bacterium]
ASDGYYARVFSQNELRALLNPDYAEISMSVIGLKAELFPFPRCRFKERIEALTPNWLASAILGRWGSMLVVEATRRRDRRLF